MSPHFSIILSLSALICSCSMQTKEVNSIDDLLKITGTLPRNKSTVFVHLPSTIQTIKGKVTVDGKAIAELPPRSFTKLTLSPGLHSIDMQFPAITGPNCEDFKFNFKKDTVYHIALVDGPKNPSLGASLVHELVYKSAHIRPVHAFDGIQISRYEKYVPAASH